MRLFFLCLVTLFALYGYGQKSNGRRIIDVHLHARAYNDYGSPPAPNPVTGTAPRWSSDQQVLQTTLETLKQNKVVKAIASGSISRIDDFFRADSNRFIPSLDYPDMQQNPLPDTTTFIRLYQEKKFRVFGELALQYEGKLLTESTLDPYLAICERLQIPVALHTGLAAPNTPYTCCPKFRTQLGNPALIEEVLIKYPKLKIQLMHMGYPYLAETKAIMYVYPQVYADIAVIDWILPAKEFHSYLKSMMDAGFGNRIMYGSDQMGWPDAIPLSIKNVENAPFLTEAQKQDIFYNNAAAFYHIK